MKTYELLTIKSVLGNYETLKATEGEREIWIPLDPANSDYAEYLRFTEWVEAGNNPEDFWDRSDDLNETIVSEETLPSEEETKIETDLGE